MIEARTISYRVNDSELERASNSYLMSVIAIMAGMPIPLINLLATFLFLMVHRKGTYFVRWHCYQAFISQLFLFFVNTTGFWWTISIVFGHNQVSNAYLSYLIVGFSFNVLELVGTLYTAIRIRKEVHLAWWFYGDITDLIVKDNE